MFEKSYVFIAGKNNRDKDNDNNHNNDYNNFA